MKKIICLLLFLLPLFAFTQLNLYKDSPLDYAWKNVGNAGFSIGQAYQPSLAISPIDGFPYMGYGDGADSQSGQPYVAYNDGTNMNKVTVMKFDGTNWVNVGSAGFSAGQAYYTEIAFNQSSQPFVGYQDFGNVNKATVMKYDSVFVGINKQRETKLLLCPNPATDKISIEISAVPTKSQLSITNLNGQQLIDRQISEPKTVIDISNLPNGVYLVS